MATLKLKKACCLALDRNQLLANYETPVIGSAVSEVSRAGQFQGLLTEAASCAGKEVSA